MKKQRLEAFEDANRYVTDEVSRLTSEVRKQSATNTTDSEFLDNQIKTLWNDKTSLQEATNILDLRVV